MRYALPLFFTVLTGLFAAAACTSSIDVGSDGQTGGLTTTGNGTASGSSSASGSSGTGGSSGTAGGSSGTTGGSSGTGGGAADAGVCSSAWTLTQPIQPPWRYAGLDWDGVTIDAVDSAPNHCPSQPLGAFGACPSGNGTCNQNAWGDADEVLIVWNVATRVVDQVELRLGYTGVMVTDPYPDHTGAMHAYRIVVGDVIRRDGLPFEIQWTDAQTRAVQITDIFNAVMATYAASALLPFDTDACLSDADCTAPGTVQVCQCTHAIDPTTMQPTADCEPSNPAASQCGVANCGSDGNCLISNDGSTTIFGFQPLKVYVQGPAGVAQPALSTPQIIYGLAYAE